MNDSSSPLSGTEIGLGSNKVLIVINSLIQAGAEALVKDLAPQLRARRVQIAVAVLKRLDNSFEKLVEQAGVPLITLSGAGFYSARHLWWLRRTMQQFDLVHSVLFPSQLWVALAAKSLPRKPALIASEQNTDNRRRRFRWLRALDGWMYRQYSAIACASHAIADSLAQWAPQVHERICVIPNAIAVEHFAAASPADKKQIIGEGDPPVILFTARLQPQKDHVTLFRALTKVHGAHLLLAGDGELRPRLMRLAQELGLASRIHFLGRRDDIPQLLKMADVYAHSAHSEGFGIATLEAMAAGVPVVASDLPGLAEVVGQAGILVPPGDSEAMANALKQLLGSAELRQKLSTAGRQRAQEFSIQKTAQQFIELYGRVLSEHQREPLRS